MTTLIVIPTEHQIYMAADTKLTSGGCHMPFTKQEKLSVVGDYVLGVSWTPSGQQTYSDLLQKILGGRPYLPEESLYDTAVKLYKQVHEYETTIHRTTDETTTCDVVLASPGGALYICNYGDITLLKNEEPFALGSGRQFALGAAYAHGNNNFISCETAIRAAIKYDLYSAGPIQYVCINRYSKEISSVVQE